MSSFVCEKCGKEIIDSPSGYTTECEHYPSIEFCEVLIHKSREQIKRSRSMIKSLQHEITRLKNRKPRQK